MTKKSNIYTRTGDEGMTSLVGGIRVPKTHCRLEAYGTIDELNSFVGLLISNIENEDDKDFIIDIQRKLFSVGSYLATDTSKRELSANSIIHPEDVECLEKIIDNIDESLPKLTSFVLPTGTQAASIAHICRTVCRRAERRILEMSEKIEIDTNVLAYINRLSDFLFVFARKLNNSSNIGEFFWKRTCK